MPFGTPFRIHLRTTKPLNSTSKILGNWSKEKAAARQQWPLLTEHDVDSIAGEREALMRAINARYGTSYGQIERDVAEFELRHVRSANAARPSLGITNDG